MGIALIAVEANGHRKLQQGAKISEIKKQGVNKHGLGRVIPSEVKRIVRERCGFGCVVCGAIPYEYDHFRIPFSDAKFHDPEDIVLLCDYHHTAKTRRLIDIDWIAIAIKADPMLRPARFKLPGTSSNFGIHWPSLEVEAVTHGIIVDGTPILSLAMRLNELEPVLLSGSLSGRDGEELCVIENNEIVVRPSKVGDFHQWSNKFQFRDRYKKKVLAFTLDSHGMHIAEIGHSRNGVMIAGNSTGLSVSNGARTLHVKSVTVTNTQVVISANSRWPRDYTKEDITKDEGVVLENCSFEGGQAAILLS